MSHIIGVGDIKISTTSSDVLITYALGSCLGITAYDPVLRIGGLLHAMLPLSNADPSKAKARPAMYVDSGFALLMRELFAKGAKKDNLVISVAGGASMKNLTSDDYFKIGQRNFTVLRKLLWKNGLMIHAQDVGGGISRTMAMHLSNGLVTINKKPIEQARDGAQASAGIPLAANR
ncbi:MAG: chemotaxis protein CheD [Bacteroidetes bacterium]|nr:chemotaxis protein CheD [Bacteroidota bacterium]